MSNLVAHAKRELSLIGEDQDTIDGIVNVVQAFADCGHSGGSAPFAIAYLEDLLKYRPLSDLTDDSDEWTDRTEMSGYPIWQSTRNPEAMSEDGGKTYWLISECEAAGSMDTTPRHSTASHAEPVA